MNKNIRITASYKLLEDDKYTTNIEFTDLDMSEVISKGNDFARIGVSWAISVKFWKYIRRFDVITAYTGRAGKGSNHNPITIYTRSEKFDVVAMLYTDTNSWDVDFVDYWLWRQFMKRGISRRYKINGNVITLPIQIINDQEVNPIVESRNFELISTRDEDNGFKEHYISYRTYRRVQPTSLYDKNSNMPLPEDFLMGYLIQKNQDGSKVIYHPDSYEVWGWY